MPHRRSLYLSDCATRAIEFLQHVLPVNPPVNRIINWAVVQQARRLGFEKKLDPASPAGDDIKEISPEETGKNLDIEPIPE